ncbi:hypothetical protein DSO57_1011403 [Entomophthora muscae]|uniref:Uncharacterized protein n=1 Tax=Entomophthora muscae TaxID=34485 RepID=A0ACC2UG26_9FUNG|nr:hypothetical protein DSO57_1011403 [Entomophthora muscae]
MEPDKQTSYLMDTSFPKLVASDLSARVSAACVNIYRRTFRIVPINPYLLEPLSPTSGVGIGLDLDISLKAAEEETQGPKPKQIQVYSKEGAGTCSLVHEKDSTTFNLTFWDKTICSFNFKDDRLAELIINISLPLAIFFSWLILSLINFWILDELDFRAEWALLFLVSFIPFYRAAKVSAQDFFTLLAVHAILDAAAGTTLVHLYPHISSAWMSTVFDFFLFANTIGSLQGFSMPTLFYVCIFTYVNHTMKGQFNTTGIAWFISIHAIGHAAYLGLGEFLVQIILLRNCNFANPIFSLDKTDMIHKFRYLGLSGKLEAVNSTTEENLDHCPVPKPGRRKQVQQKKQVSPKPKSLSDVKAETHESLVLRPSVGEIVDSFDLCIDNVGPTSITLHWAIPISFLYLLAKCSVFIKEFDERDRVIQTSSALTVADFESNLTDGEVMRRIDITLRINGSTWPHWTINKDYSAITISNLHALTNYKVTMAVIGFRSAPSFVTTLPVNLDSSIPTDEESALFIRTFKRLIELEQDVHDERRMKKDEQLAVKKLRRNIAQQEANVSLELHQAIKALERAKQEDGRVMQTLKSLKQSIQHIQARISACHSAHTVLSEKIKDVEPRLISANYRLSCARAGLKELRASYRKMESNLQQDLGILLKEKQRQTSNSSSLEKRIARLTQSSILQITEKIEDMSAKMESTQSQLTMLLKQNSEVQAFLAQADSLGSWHAALNACSFGSLLTEESQVVLSAEPSKLSGQDFLLSLESRVSSIQTKVTEIEKAIASYRDAAASEGEFVVRLEAEERRVLALVADRPKENDSGIED